MIVAGSSTRVAAITYLSTYLVKMKSESEVAHSCLTLATPWTVAYKDPQSMGFSRQEYWSWYFSPGR